MKEFYNGRKVLVTGCAGFIGSHIVEELLNLGADVVGVDNFATGHHKNLLTNEKFKFYERDIRDENVVNGIDLTNSIVIHQAAIGSVPRSIVDPVTSDSVNVGGFVNFIHKCHKNGAQKFVYASSSSVYGDSDALPKVEAVVGRPLSPYAATKMANELYAHAFSNSYGISLTGLRYFNVFGPRQDPEGAYAAVIPKWVAQLVQGKKCEIYGDGETSRDFCYIKNVVSANLLAGKENLKNPSSVFNVAAGMRTTLTDLYTIIYEELSRFMTLDPALKKPTYQEFRTGDIRHSHADISKIEHELGYKALVNVPEGLKITTEWFFRMANK